MADAKPQAAKTESPPIAAVPESLASTDPSLVTPTLADMLPHPSRFEIRSPNPGFTGVRGAIAVENKKTAKMEMHDGVRIVKGVGWTDDHHVANECLRFGYKVTDHKRD